jgi:hypothetical protein
LSDEPSFLGSLRNSLAQPNSGKTKTGAASFWDFLADQESVNEKPLNLLPAQKEAFDENSFFWAMRNLPVTEATKHFLICGCSGSGKTVTIRLFLQSIAPRFQQNWKKNEQLILFDAKNDANDVLKAMGIDPAAPHVWILNPVDPNSAVWNIAETVQSPTMARHFATLLVPEERNSNTPYFADGARELVYAVLLGFIAVAGLKWTLRDLLCALESQDRIKAVASQDPRAQILVARILEDDRHSAGILSTLGTKLGRFEQVAALWHAQGAKAARSFCIRKFLEHPGVLVLGNDPVLRDSFWPITAMLLKALTQEILREPETLEPRHWFVLDEFRAMERVQCIHDLLNLGRSKGASVLIGLQSIDGLLELYGQNGANDLLTQCASKTFLRAGGPATAKWAETFFGTVRTKEIVVTESSQGFTTNTSKQHTIAERAVLIASYFMNLPLPRRGGDYTAVCDVPCLERFFIVNRPFDEVLSWRWKAPKSVDSPSHRRGPSPADEILKPWTDAETASFCTKQSNGPNKVSQFASPPPTQPISKLSAPSQDNPSQPSARKVMEDRWTSQAIPPDSTAPQT